MGKFLTKLYTVAFAFSIPVAAAMAIDRHFTSAIADKYSAPWIGEDFSAVPCKGRPQGYGPYDYRRRSTLYRELRQVEGAHFPPRVEALIRGKTGINPYSDIAYTLRAWPNHHRALNSISRYYFKFKNSNKRMNVPPECFFQRAINFAPDDDTTYMLYAIYLQKRGKYKQSEENYLNAIKLSPDDPQTNYNYGLLLFKLEKYKEARDAAIKAYDQSYPFPGLKNKLKNAGYWP